MFTKNEDPIIISVGGSLIVPDQIDTEFLLKLNTFIRKYIAQGKRFFLVSGGGKTARNYRDAGKTVIGDMSDVDLDWIGTHATRLNGHLLRTIFVDIAHPRVIENYEKRLENWSEPLVIGAGWKPGHSSDYCAVTLAKDYGGKLMINLSNIDWIYDKDPKAFPDAKLIKKMSWEECQTIVGTKWSPGLKGPFDPIPSMLPRDLNLTAIVTNGNDFSNLESIIEGKEFKGTVISPSKG